MENNELRPLCAFNTLPPEHFTESDRAVIRNILEQRIGVAPTSKDPEEQAAEIQRILQEEGLDMNERLDAVVTHLLETYPGLCREVIAAVLGREGTE